MWWHWLLVAAGVLVVSWVVMIVLAKRLPPGLAQGPGDRVAGMHDHRRIPEFLPVIGPLDDIVVVALALRYASRRIPPQVLVDAWPADRRILARLAPSTERIDNGTI
jgi:hypothetical protein